ADLVLINPEIVKKSESYETEEGCLSLKGTRKTIRYNRITVVYQDESFHPKRKEFTGALAQIIQHECDHCEGILI
ncbi:MAG: peptide deformylase, partial [Erysipelotrichales bacterium]|nr:peptide deformylase [Erysipelotrichales bacterium]